MSRKSFFLIVALSALSVGVGAPLARPELNAWTCPSWWTDAKFGVFIHWGVYSVPAYAAPCEHAWVYRIEEGDTDASGVVSRAEKVEPKWVSVFNQDSTNFMITHGDEKMNAAGIREYLDSVIGHGAFTHFFICPNAQTAIFDSKTMSPSWWRLTAKGKYQIRLGNDFLQSEVCPRREYLLHTNGVDIIQVYIDGCRAKGVSPWLSMRMNDGHVPENPQWWGHSQFWVDHPEYRREGGFDFSHPEVRAYHLAFVHELLERYDVDGFECDWMRWPFKQRTDDLTEMMREIRKLVSTAARRRGHEILVGARVSSRPDAARAHAMDVVAWAKEGLVDWVVPCNFFSSADFELPLGEWKRLLAGSNVRVIPGTDTGVRIGDPVAKKVTIDRRLLTLAEYREWADRMQRQGADGIYFFNLFTYHEPAYHATTTEPWDVIVREGLSPQAIQGKAKSFPQGWIYEP